VHDRANAWARSKKEVSDVDLVFKISVCYGHTILIKKIELWYCLVDGIYGGASICVFNYLGVPKTVDGKFTFF
jgi:hypothetical protein